MLQNHSQSAIEKLNDVELRAALRLLAISDREAQVEMLLHLAELDLRATFVCWGYASLWDYCRRELLFSEAIAVRRIACARAAKKFPAAITFVRDGRLNLCGLALLAPILNDENASTLLLKACGMTKRQIEGLVVESGVKDAPPLKKDVIRLIGAVPASPEAKAPIPNVTTAKAPATVSVPNGSAPLIPEPVRRINVHRISFNGSDELIENISRLKEILGQRDLNYLMKRACEALLDRVDPVRRHHRREAKAKHRAEKARAKAKKVDSGRPKATTSHRQPLALKDAVHVRDEDRCTYESADGVRCGAKGYLHIDHIRPYALGGSSLEIGNSRLLCSAHNLLRGRQTFGDQRRSPTQ